MHTERPKPAASGAVVDAGGVGAHHGRLGLSESSVGQVFANALGQLRQSPYSCSGKN